MIGRKPGYITWDQNLLPLRKWCRVSFIINFFQLPRLMITVSRSRTSGRKRERDSLIVGRSLKSLPWSAHPMGLRNLLETMNWKEFLSLIGDEAYKELDEMAEWAQQWDFQNSWDRQDPSPKTRSLYEVKDDAELREDWSVPNFVYLAPLNSCLLSS